MLGISKICKQHFLKLKPLQTYEVTISQRALNHFILKTTSFYYLNLTIFESLPGKTVVDSVLVFRPPSPPFQQNICFGTTFRVGLDRTREIKRQRFSVEVRDFCFPNANRFSDEIVAAKFLGFWAPKCHGYRRVRRVR